MESIDRFLVLRALPTFTVYRAPARMRWDSAYAMYRAARRENVCGYLTPREILSRFLPPRGEVGVIGGMRIIETEGGP